jgi:hypothetical protein
LRKIVNRFSAAADAIVIALLHCRLCAGTVSLSRSRGLRCDKFPRVIEVHPFFASMAPAPICSSSISSWWNELELRNKLHSSAGQTLLNPRPQEPQRVNIITRGRLIHHGDFASFYRTFNALPTHLSQLCRFSNLLQPITWASLEFDTSCCDDTPILNITEHPWSPDRYLGRGTPSGTEEEDLSHEKAASTVGWQGTEGCQKSKRMPRMWGTQASASSMSNMCGR